jgi:hypothetical protein
LRSPKAKPIPRRAWLKPCRNFDVGLIKTSIYKFVEGVYFKYKRDTYVLY